MRPSREELKNYDQYSHIPVSMEIMSDLLTPISVLRNIKAVSKKHYLLESASNERWGRYSFLGFDPILEVSCKDSEITLVKNNEKEKFNSTDPINELRKIINCYNTPTFDYLPTFTGGLVGYAAYDLIKYSYPINLSSKDVAGFNDYHFMLFDKVIAFDNLRQKVIIIINIENNCNVDENYQKAIVEMKKLIDIICCNKSVEIKPNKIIKEIVANDTLDIYKEKLSKIKEHIIDGDIFQCVFSRRFKGKMAGDLFNTYRVLRTFNPSPYMVYLDTEELQIASSSPETLVKKEGNLLQTFPIAGSRPRGKTEKEDLELERELLNDPKELAEHNMLVDLGRNDVGRVSKFGSVEVINYQYVMKFSHIMHITSTVNGIIDDKSDSLDTLKSILPAGTLSGAPKLRAMEIIDSLEDERRGIYGGAIGYIDFRGNMDMAIVIRTVIKKGEDVYVQAGGGIVLDSDPILEYQETENKAKAILKALKESGSELI